LLLGTRSNPFSMLSEPDEVFSRSAVAWSRTLGIVFCVLVRVLISFLTHCGFSSEITVLTTVLSKSVSSETSIIVSLVHSLCHFHSLFLNCIRVNQYYLEYTGQSYKDGHNLY
jgi:hypothetical protein